MFAFKRQRPDRLRALLQTRRGALAQALARTLQALSPRILRVALLYTSCAIYPHLSPGIDIVIQYRDTGENPGSDPDGAWLNYLFNAAASYWENYLPDSGTYELDVEWSASHFSDPSTLGQWEFDPDGDDNIYVNSSKSWFYDSSPFDHSEFDFATLGRTPNNDGTFSYLSGQWLSRDIDASERSAWFDGNVPSLLEIGFRGQAVNPLAAGKFDLLSTVIHELGHALGVNDSGGPWSALPEWVDGSGNVEFVEDNGHLAARTSLMCDSCGAVGIRRLPSAIDIMAAADDEGFDHIDLPRKDFAAAGGDWNTSANWLGNRVPDSDDWVYIRSDANVSMSANSSAARLTIAPLNGLNTQDHSLLVSDSIIVNRSLNMAGHLTVPTNGSVATEHVVLNGELFNDGGSTTAGTDITIGSFGVLRGHGHVSAATLVNNGVIRAESGTLTIDGLVSANFGGDAGGGMLDATQGNLNLTALLTPDFQGTARIGSAHSIHQQVAWKLGTNGVLRLEGTSPISAVLSGERVMVRGTVESSGRGTISAPVDFEPTARVQIANNGRLRLAGSTTYKGGLYVGGGTLVQQGNSTVAESTIIDVDTLDLDGDVDASPSTMTILPGKTLQINSRRIEDAANVGDGFDGTFNVNSSVLQINTHDFAFPRAWRMEGTLNLSGSIFDTARVQGSTMIVGDPGALGFPGVAKVNVLGGITAIEAPVIFEPSANVVVANGGLLRLANTTRFQGGNHSGPGTVVQAGPATVEANTLIQYGRYYLDGLDATSTTIRPGVVFTVDTRQISTSPDNRFDGSLAIQGGRLEMRTHTTVIGPNGPYRLETPWRMAGDLDLVAAEGFNPRIGGSAFSIGEPDMAEAEARVRLGDSRAEFDVPRVTFEERSVLELGIDGTSPGQFGSLELAGSGYLGGALAIEINERGGSYGDPVQVGDFDEFPLIAAGAIEGEFTRFEYDGMNVLAAFSSPGYFRAYLGDGLFRNLEYGPTTVSLVNYRALPGDANGDRVVDGVDFGIWNANKFSGGTDWTRGDFNGDGLTDGSDFGIWNANKFTSAVGARLIPEPTGIGLFLAGIVTIAMRRSATFRSAAKCVP